MASLNITVAFPIRGSADDIQAWKDAVLWALKNVPASALSVPSAPGAAVTLPAMPEALRAYPMALEKGPWEREWLAKAKTKSVRWTPRVQSLVVLHKEGEHEGEPVLDGEGNTIPLYRTKEDYCEALCKGTATTAKDGEAESDGEASPPVLPEVEKDWH